MTEDEFRRRVLEIEAHYDERIRSANWHDRLYVGNALACMAFMTEVVEAEFYAQEFPEITRPEPKSSWCREELERWEAVWSKRDR